VINENENENNMKKEIRLVLTMTMLLALCVGVVACCAMAIGSAVREDDGNTVGYSFMAVVFAVFATKLVQVAKAIMEKS
jgi:O-antigen/teichoic acid export membrane protein